MFWVKYVRLSYIADMHGMLIHVFESLLHFLFRNVVSEKHV